MIINIVKYETDLMYNRRSKLSVTHRYDNKVYYFKLISKIEPHKTFLRHNRLKTRTRGRKSMNSNKLRMCIENT